MCAQSITFGSPIKVLDFGELYSSYTWEDDASAVLRSQVSDRASDIIKASNEKAWPAGIATLDTRTQNRAKMYDYALYYLTTVEEHKAILLLPASENSGMPQDMRPENDIYFVINDGAIQLKTDAGIAENFDTQLEQITRDFKNSFINVINAEVTEDLPDGTTIYESRVMLEGAYQVLFFDDEDSGTTAFRAAFPGNSDPAIARIDYEALVSRVEALTLTCCRLSKNAEQTNGESRSQTFSAIDPKGDPDFIYHDMVIEIGMERSEDVDEDGETVILWEPVIYIYQQ